MAREVEDNPPVTPSATAREERALAQSVLYRLVAAGFRYPSAEILDEIGRQGYPARTAMAAIDAGPTLLDAWFSEVGKKDARQLEDAYMRHFGHIVQGRCPP